MKILTLLALLALSAYSNTFAKNASKTKSLPVNNVGAGGLKFTTGTLVPKTNPVVQVTATPPVSETPAASDVLANEYGLAAPQLSLGILKPIASLIGKIPPITTP